MEKLYIKLNENLVGGVPALIKRLSDEIYYPPMKVMDEPTATIFNNRVVYVTQSGAGNKSGQSWENAMDNVYIAITYAASLVQGGVQAAVYIEEGKYNLTGGISTTVSLFGGFLIHDKRWERRDPFKHKTIFDARGGSQNITANAYDGLVFVDGITLINKTSGNSSGFYALHCTKIQNCIAENCYKADSADIQGAGFYSSGSAYCYSCVASNCHGSFIDTPTTGNIGGGGFYLDQSVGDNCIAFDCSSISGGGFYLSGQASIQNCESVNCFASEYGGGFKLMISPEAGNCTATDCTATDCVASEYGGGFYFNGSTATYCKALNCTQSFGGGFRVGESSITNCEAINCGAIQCGGGFCVLEDSNIINCIAKNCSSSGGGGFYVNQNGIDKRFEFCTAINCSVDGIYVATANSFISNCAVWNDDTTEICIHVDDTSYVTYCAYHYLSTAAGADQYISHSQILQENPFKNGGYSPLNISGRYATYLPYGTLDVNTIIDFKTMLTEQSADVHPKSGSVLFEHGVSTLEETDFDGITRSNPPTIGAYETIGD